MWEGLVVSKRLEAITLIVQFIHSALMALPALTGLHQALMW